MAARSVEYTSLSKRAWRRLSVTGTFPAIFAFDQAIAVSAATAKIFPLPPATAFASAPL